MDTSQRTRKDTDLDTIQCQSIFLNSQINTQQNQHTEIISENLIEDEFYDMSTIRFVNSIPSNQRLQTIKSEENVEAIQITIPNIPGNQTELSNSNYNQNQNQNPNNMMSVSNKNRVSFYKKFKLLETQESIPEMVESQQLQQQQQQQNQRREQNFYSENTEKEFQDINFQKGIEPRKLQFNNNNNKNNNSNNKGQFKDIEYIQENCEYNQNQNQNQNQDIYEQQSEELYSFNGFSGNNSQQNNQNMTFQYNNQEDSIQNNQNSEQQEEENFQNQYQYFYNNQDEQVLQSDLSSPEKQEFQYQQYQQQLQEQYNMNKNNLLFNKIHERSHNKFLESFNNTNNQYKIQQSEEDMKMSDLWTNPSCSSNSGKKDQTFQQTQPSIQNQKINEYTQQQQQQQIQYPSDDQLEQNQQQQMQNESVSSFSRYNVLGNSNSQPKKRLQKSVQLSFNYSEKKKQFYDDEAWNRNCFTEQNQNKFRNSQVQFSQKKQYKDKYLKNGEVFKSQQFNEMVSGLNQLFNKHKPQQSCSQSWQNEIENSEFNGYFVQKQRHSKEKITPKKQPVHFLKISPDQRKKVMQTSFESNCRYCNTAETKESSSHEICQNLPEQKFSRPNFKCVDVNRISVQNFIRNHPQNNQNNHNNNSYYNIN